MNHLLCAAILMTLCACSGEPEEEPTVKPDTYDIRRVDLMRPTPKDFCRAADESFLSNLIQRAKEKIPVDLWSSFSFEDFNVTDPDVGGQRIAVLRFRVEQLDGSKPMMVAAGPFDPNGCKIGPLKVAEGTSTAVFD